MASRNLPGGLALNGFWDLGEDGWNTGMDENLLKLSTLSHLSVISATTTLPGSPSEGDTYLVPSGDPEGDKVAVYDDAAWTYLDPFEGLQGYVQDDDQVLIYRDGAWGAQGFMRVFDEATASHTAVLAEANSYKRLSNASGVLLTIPAMRAARVRIAGVETEKAPNVSVPKRTSAKNRLRVVRGDGDAA